MLICASSEFRDSLRYSRQAAWERLAGSVMDHVVKTMILIESQF